MTDIAPLSENQPDQRESETSARDRRRDGLARWGIVGTTVLGVAGLAVLHFRGGSVDLRWRDAGLSYNVNPPIPDSNDGSTDAGTAELAQHD